MSGREYGKVEELSDEELYNLMGIEQKIYESRLHIHRGNAVHVAFDSRSRVVAVNGNKERAYDMAIIRGCTCPMVLRGFEVNQETRDKHNRLLDKSLERRAKEDLERKLNAEKGL